MVKSLNEKKTENLVRKIFEKNKEIYGKVTIDEQKTEIPRVKKLLQNASKSGNGVGKPEFIVTFDDFKDLIIVVECKADISKHESKNKDKYRDYAVDGVLLYSSYLSKEFDVISIAVSGEDEKESKISHFLQLKGDEKSHKILGEKILTFENYFQEYQQDERKFKQSYDDLLKYSKKINDYLHSKKITEAERSLLISGILISLDDEGFQISYQKQNNPKFLAENLVTVIKQQLIASELPIEKVNSLIHHYNFIKTHPTLSKNSDEYKNVLRELIEDIDKNINSFMKTYKYYDVLGQFYIEFLRYANNDKGLGIVLTPPHITELFSDLAFVNKDSITLDNCTGTGGFLISAMKKMIDDAKGDKEKIKKIKKEQLIGIEFQPNIFALGCSNMYIHQDGKSSIYFDSCFNKETINEIKSKYKPNVGFLNPPYNDDIDELEFILNNLSMLEKGGYCVSIIPMSCVLADKGNRLELKKKLLKEHTLEAVFSMPDELFTNSKVGTVTVIVIFKAHQPHPTNYETFFGYWKDDGFEKRKITGRSDYLSKWKNIKREWLDSYINKKEVKGISIKKNVSASDEWCAETYLETNYDKLTKEDFEKTIKNFVTFKFQNMK